MDGQEEQYVKLPKLPVTSDELELLRIIDVLSRCVSRQHERDEGCVSI